MPGAGGLEPGTVAQFPSRGKFAGKPGVQCGDGESCVAAPATRSASVAVPVRTRSMSVVFDGGICQTLASYVSTQVVPTMTASGVHVVSGPVPGTPCNPWGPEGPGMPGFPGIPGRPWSPVAPVGPIAPNCVRSIACSFFLQAWRRTTAPDFFVQRTTARAGALDVRYSAAARAVAVRRACRLAPGFRAKPGDCFIADPPSRTPSLVLTW